jgi:hypothetical protein
MGLMSLDMLRSRENRQRLPVYEPLKSPGGPPASPTKETYDDEYSSDQDESDYSDIDVSGPSSNCSRQTSSDFSSSAAMLPKRAAYAHMSPSRPRRIPRPHLYRLPNKVIRYLCIGMISTILLFMFSLIRASQVENRRIANGEVDKTAPPPPPWSSFEFLTRYYGGVRTLLPLDENVPQYPRDEDEQTFNATNGYSLLRPHLHPEDHQVNDGPLPLSKPFAQYPGNVLSQVRDEITQCFVDQNDAVSIPPIRYFDGRPGGFPRNIVGSYELLDLPEDICFERYGRLGPYGFGYSVRTGGLGAGEHGEQEGSEEIWKEGGKFNWRNVDWADAQRRCFRSNTRRFKPVAHRVVPTRGFWIDEEPSNATIVAREEAIPPVREAGEIPQRVKQAPSGDIPRTAIVVRLWDEFNWNAEAIMYLRSLIAELSLASGSRYDVHFLVEVKNDAKHPIWADADVYAKHLEDAVPAEFRGLVTFWTQTQMLSLYQGIHDLYTRGPELPVHGWYRGLQMAMQWFAYEHPEYEYFWQWEMDIRYTGHYYDLLAKMERWAAGQPRKGLWERNARFYMPDVHGSWDDFRQMARVQTEIGTVSAENVWSKLPNAKKPQEIVKGERTVWGPVRPTHQDDWFETENDPEPPTTYEKDKYVWGVGEEADLITMSPIFDPEGTTWLLADDITGYNETGGAGKPPRRAQIITASRMSRRLLLTMHRETALRKKHAFPEMWPATIALQHGLKAVYVPHPVYVDREWPTQYMAQTLNAGRNGASGGSRSSVFGQREHNLLGVTWFYNSGFAPNLYKRWIGLKVNNDGGEEFELTADQSRDGKTVGSMRGGEGRMCLPPMLLHPVKDVELPVEENPDEIETVEPEMGPDA